jgi:flavin reductase (DIM6/NTAB) family NADH-FMN oxidoreductase RutF
LPADEEIMFYSTKTNDHGLPYDPLKALVAPRPIGWITSISARGEVNLAPYSYFNAVSTRPPIVCFSSEGRKDSVALVEESGEFVCNLATWDLRDAMNLTSAPFPRGVDELREAGLTPAPSRLIKAPRVAEAPWALECKWLQTLTLRDLDGRPLDRFVAFGQVVGVHIDDRFIANGRVDTAAMKPIARCGYDEYAVVAEVFAMTRPERADVAAPRVAAGGRRAG